MRNKIFYNPFWLYYSEHAQNTFFLKKGELISILFKKGLTSTLHYLCQFEKSNASLFCGILDSAEKVLPSTK